MRLPIPLGTVLQNRYYLIDLLGLRGFGRTYLAKDLERDSELCALKELIPEGVADQSEFYERFREQVFALFRIRHPQIPQFRTTFEQDNRLFLVQDYIEGKSYATLLNERKAPRSSALTGTTNEETLPFGGAFSEEEVLQLLLQLLPALEYLHGMGISHGRISPENIILPATDSRAILPEDNDTSTPATPLPVLIDLGVVNEMMSRLKQLATAGGQPAEVETPPADKNATSNDLYALAVTAVVLLTGRKPQELFDNTKLIEDWQSFVPASPQFARILNRMLSDSPENRYQSAREVAGALLLLSFPAPNTRLPTTTQPQRPTPQPSIWGNPWAYVLSAGLVLTAGIGSWAAIRSLMDRPLVPATLTQTPAASTSAPSSPQPNATPQPLNVVPDKITTVEGTLSPNQTLTYLIPAQQWQLLSASLTGTGVLMSVLNQDRQPMNQPVKPVERWEGLLSSSGDYYLQLNPAQGSEPKPYKLDINLTGYFPRKLCQDPDAEGIERWYPVLIEYSPEALQRVQSDYCRDTFITPKASAGNPAVLVGSFGDQAKAQAFADLMNREVGSATVGEPTAGSPKSSCSDPDPGGTQTWYPVLVEYTKEHYIQILSYCPNASVTQKSSGKGSYIEIATFLDKSKAAQMANFITQEVASAEVGAASTRPVPKPAGVK
ncbi:serine/threonine-protein kinase [Microcoleus sp. FACHB-68]|uniref:serine/threonine protein kinase n=1 Tax=Microcoleus sp. FACHB-68 TaxID=2692826 RepID=UPI001686837E|nr:serine/threonine-protein kinase [Microcoleus sp. FACHB-68]MBD1937294.1 serine/threonine protein kinase [Microcoleus sp. FACHB-68]